MKKILAMFISLIMILSLFSACTPPEATDPEKGSEVNTEEPDDSGSASQQASRDEDPGTDGETWGTPSVESGSRSEDPGSEAKESDDYEYASRQQAEIASEVGLQEYRAYMRGDFNGSHYSAIQNRYVNRYLRPYLKEISKDQVLVEPETIQSDWFRKENTSLSMLVRNSSYANMYRKMAQDMLPYMLSDPDDMLDGILKVYHAHGLSGDDAKKRIDPAEIIADYEAYDPMEYEISWSYDWEKFNRDFHYNYPGDYYALSAGKDRTANVSFIAPSYNERYLVDIAVFGENDKDNRTTIEPFSDATVLLTELTDIKDRSPDAKEFYIQTVSLNITMPTREEAYEVLSEAFACIQPYNTERGRQEIISKSQDAIYVPMGEEDWSTGELQYVYSMQPFYWGHEERFKFDPVIDFESNRDYTPTYSPSPLYNRRINSKNPYSPGYYVDGWESYFNHTCDTHLDYRLTEYQDKDDCTLFFQIRYAGPTANAMNQRANKNDGWSWVDWYGIYYPLTVPIYYNEAALNGFFTPYDIPEKREESSLGGLIPIYETEKPVYTEDTPYVSMNEKESDSERLNRWLSEGFGKDSHDFGPHPKEREKVDWSGRKGYTKTEDGKWRREMETKSPSGGKTVEKHTLTYDETGLLESGYIEYKDGSTKHIDYRTDIDGNPINSIERVYDKDGRMTEQMYNDIRKDGSVSRRTFYSTESGPSGYEAQETADYDRDGNVTNWTKWNPNGSPKFRKTSVSWDEMGGTTGNPVTIHHTLVTESEHDEYGNVISTHEKQFATEKSRDTHTITEYLLDMSLVKSEWF